MASDRILPKMKVKQKLNTAKNALRAVRDGAISASELAKLEKELKGLSANADGPTKAQLDRVANQLNEAKSKVKPRVKLKASTQSANTAPKPRIKPKAKAKPKADTRGPQKPAPKSTLKNITDTAGRTASRIGKLAKGVTGVGALLTASEAGAGSDVVPASRRDEFVKKMDAEREAKQKAQGRGRGDGAKETATRRAAQADKKRVNAATKANTADKQRQNLEKDKKRVDAATKANKAANEPRSIAEAKRRGLDYFVGKDGKRKAAVTAEELKASGMSLREYLNKKQGKTTKMASGGMVKANCGASMKPTQKSSKGMK